MVKPLPPSLAPPSLPAILRCPGSPKAAALTGRPLPFALATGGAHILGAQSPPPRASPHIQVNHTAPRVVRPPPTAPSGPLPSFCQGELLPSPTDPALIVQRALAPVFLLCPLKRPPKPLFPRATPSVSPLQTAATRLPVFCFIFCFCGVDRERSWGSQNQGGGPGKSRSHLPTACHLSHPHRVARALYMRGWHHSHDHTLKQRVRNSAGHRSSPLGER